MAVLAELDHQNAGRAAFELREHLDFIHNPLEVLAVGVDAAVNALGDASHGAVPAPALLQGAGDLADGGPLPRGLNAQVQQVAGAVLGGLGETVQGGLGGGFVAFGAHFGKPSNLGLAHLGVVDFQDVHLGVVRIQLILVDADDDLLAPFDAGLAAGRGFLDALLGHAFGDGLGHAAQRLDFGNELARLADDGFSEAFHVVAAAQGVHGARHAGFLGDDDLRVAGDARREGRRQGDGFVEGVGVQALGAAEHRGQRLYGGAHHVVVGVLLLQRDPGGLAVGAQHRRRRVGGLELRHQLGPEDARRPQLRHLHEEVHADAEEERQARRELVDLDAGGQRRPNVLHAVRQGEGHFLDQIGARLLHVIAGYGDGVEARHVLRSVADDVGDDAHALLGRIDVGVAHHEFLQNVVLNGAGQGGRSDPLLLAGDDVAGHHRQHGAVHGHGDGHLIEGNAVEENLHVLDRIDGHPGLADVARHPRMVRVIAPVGRQVEGDGEPLLPGGQVVPIEAVGLLGGGETGVLANGPGPVGVHGGPRPAHEGGEAWQGIHLLQSLQVGAGVQRLDVDAFRAAPRQAVNRLAAQLLFRQGLPAVVLMFGHKMCSLEPPGSLMIRPVRREGLVIPPAEILIRTAFVGFAKPTARGSPPCPPHAPHDRRRQGHPWRRFILRPDPSVTKRNRQLGGTPCPTPMPPPLN